jgi:hypothetical protein
MKKISRGFLNEGVIEWLRPSKIKNSPPSLMNSGREGDKEDMSPN